MKLHDVTENEDKATLALSVTYMENLVMLDIPVPEVLYMGQIEFNVFGIHDIYIFGKDDNIGI